MYVPDHFHEPDLATLHDFIERNNFGILVTQHNGEPFATHLPFVLDRPKGILLAHLARANAQSQDLTNSSQALAIFHGPHAYISPSWYVNPKNVPTWNYIAVHAYGRLEAIDDPRETLEVLRLLVAKHESPSANPWKFDESADWISNLARGIVAFRFHIGRLEGKFKLGQNRAPEDRAAAAGRLAASDREMDRELAARMLPK
jgi:transcriptional regulator